VGQVPTFDHEAVTAHSRSLQEIREWIAEGRPRRLAEEADESGDDTILRMPAWGTRLRDDELDALVAYIAAVSDFEPVPDEVARGRATAARFGCFACHGPQGRGDTPNPGSLKGYIPSWSGADFPELARDDGEIHEWIRDGAPRRLREHPVAGWFLQRQQIRMPAYGDRVSDEDVARITGYILWLRRSAPRP
jgi:mono/diheme cytochrome c family protein